MPALRLTSTSRRRRSSHALFTPAKAGTYGIPARPVTFAPNVTPITYTEVDPEDDPSNPLSSYALSLAAASGGDGTNASVLTSKLFPPSETPAPPPTRKRCPPGKRRSQGYIPRPPNAFMLFRADFVRQKHVPGSIETNHGSLSKIIGTCWRQLPLDEKRVWEVKAKHEKAAHKAMFPDYRFRPVHNKNKNASSSSSHPSSSTHPPSSHSHSHSDEVKRKEKQPTTAEDERRCDEVAQLLLEGKKGEELARAVRSLDRARSMERERKLEMEEYELGLGAEEQESSRQSYDFGNVRGQHEHEQGTLHMPVSLHPHPQAFGGGSYALSPFMHNGMGLSSSMGPSMNYHRRSSSVPLPNEWHAHAQAYPYPYPSSNGIAIPSIPHLTSLSRPASPVGSIARFTHSFPPHSHQAQFSDPFSQHQQQQQSFPTTPNTGEYTFAPIPEYTPHAQIFHPIPHPHPQALMPFMSQTTPRSSLGLAQRRASSAQPLLMRSWTMPSEYDYSFGGDMGMNVERDPSPLPEVESGLFADFSFGGSSNSMGGGEESQIQHSKPASACGDEMVDPSSPGSGLGLGLNIGPTSLARIDTSLSYSPTTTVPPSSISTSTASSSSECSPVTGVDVLPDANANAASTSNATGRMDSLDMSAYMHLDRLYASDPSTSNYAMYDQQQQQQQPQGYPAEAYSMNMGYYQYDVDPVVKAHSHSQEVYPSGTYFEATA